MKHEPPQDQGWVGWKSIVLGVVLLYFLKPFGGPVREVVQVETAKPAQKAEALQEASKNASFLTAVLSDQKRKEILDSIDWESNSDFPLQGDEKAKKGGSFRMAASNFPPTIRTTGKDASDTQIAMIESIVYQTLVGLNPDPYYFYPQLASRWSMSDDKMSFFFEIDADATWSDGKPVRAEDVVATWDLYTDKDIQDPATNETWAKFNRPIALDERTVMVKAKELSWRNFMTFSSIVVLPGYIISKLGGTEYLKKYNWKMLPGSGPYILDKLEKPRMISFKRRKDFWGWGKRQFKGLFNFDRFSYMFVKDEELVFEKFKKGEFGFMPIYRSHRWVTQLNFEKVQKGWIQKRKVFNRRPKGTQGFAFNLRKAPFNDKRVREAMGYLWNRGILMEKLMLNEYVYLDSYFQNSPYMGSSIPKIRYNPDKARELLREAGWVNRNAEGWLEKDGKIFEFQLRYVGKWVEKFYTIFQEDLKKVGIKLTLKEITWATKIKEVNERNFVLTTGAYTGSSFPNPEMTYHSKFADIKNSGNRWGFKNKRVDEICEAYNAEFDYEKRVELLQELDGILANEFLVAFDWFAPAERLVFWNRFGMPDSVIAKTGDYRDVVSMWWYDESKAEALKEAIKTEGSLPVGASDVYPTYED